MSSKEQRHKFVILMKYLAQLEMTKESLTYYLQFLIPFFSRFIVLLELGGTMNDNAYFIPLINF